MVGWAFVPSRASFGNTADAAARLGLCNNRHIGHGRFSLFFASSLPLSLSVLFLGRFGHARLSKQAGTCEESIAPSPGGKATMCLGAAAASHDGPGRLRCTGTRSSDSTQRAVVVVGGFPMSCGQVPGKLVSLTGALVWSVAWGRMVVPRKWRWATPGSLAARHRCRGGSCGRTRTATTPKFFTAGRSVSRIDWLEAKGRGVGRDGVTTRVPPI